MSRIFLIIFSSILTGQMTLSAAQDYWRADDYYLNSSSQKDAAADLLKYVPLAGDEVVLDVGCGDGKITAEIASQLPFGAVVGLDISPSMIDFAQKTFTSDQYLNLEFVLGDAGKLKYRDVFDIVFSFTALQWVDKHSAFLKGAYKSLKPGGILAVTMPMGLPTALDQAVNEIIALPQWSPYFKNFSTGWNFVEDDKYAKLLSKYNFSTVRLAVVPQKDIFPSRDVFEKFISQWFPYMRPLPQTLHKAFMKQVLDRYLELEAPFPNGEVHFKIRRLEVVATKTNAKE